MNQSAPQFRLLGLEASPYTMKVESFLKFKGIQYEWINRSLKNEKLFQNHAKVQLIPLLFFPSGETMQDSTPLIEKLEAKYANPSIRKMKHSGFSPACSRSSAMNGATS